MINPPWCTVTRSFLSLLRFKVGVANSWPTFEMLVQKKKRNRNWRNWQKLGRRCFGVRIKVGRHFCFSVFFLKKKQQITTGRFPLFFLLIGPKIWFISLLIVVNDKWNRCSFNGPRRRHDDTNLVDGFKSWNARLVCLPWNCTVKRCRAGRLDVSYWFD